MLGASKYTTGHWIGEGLSKYTTRRLVKGGSGQIYHTTRRLVKGKSVPIYPKELDLVRSGQIYHRIVSER